MKGLGMVLLPGMLSHTVVSCVHTRAHWAGNSFFGLESGLGLLANLGHRADPLELADRVLRQFKIFVGGNVPAGRNWLHTRERAIPFQWAIFKFTLILHITCRRIFVPNLKTHHFGTNVVHLFANSDARCAF